MNFSNSTTDKTERLRDTEKLANQWESINWHRIENDVNRLQSRIAKATIMLLPETVKNCLSRMSGKLSRTVLRRRKGSNPFSLVDFTNADYVSLLEQSGVRINMDGKGQCLDNVRTERFFRTLKYDRIYINEIDSPRELRRLINEYMKTYNYQRPHSALDGFSPSKYYMEKSMKQIA